MEEDRKSETNVLLACFLVVAIPLGLALVVVEFVAIYQPVRAGTGSSKLAVFVAAVATMFSALIVVFGIAWVLGGIIDFIQALRRKWRS